MKVLLLAAEPVDVGALFAPAADGVMATITSILPVAIPVFVVLAGIGIALKVFSKFGVRR